MSNNIQFAGSSYETIGQAARGWAQTALPDVTVIGVEENSADVTQNLEAFWWGEALKIGEGQPEGVREDTWRADCRYALVRRIEDARAT